MQIEDQDIFHGVVLTQLTEHPSFQSIKRPDMKYGHYLINDEVRLFIKYLSQKSSPWTFQFIESELQSIHHDLTETENVFLCLVCGLETICALNIDEFSKLIHLKAADLQSITVTLLAGGYVDVKGTLGHLGKTLWHNSFPEKIYNRSTIELF